MSSLSDEIADILLAGRRREATDLLIAAVEEHEGRKLDERGRWRCFMGLEQAWLRQVIPVVDDLRRARSSQPSPVPGDCDWSEP